MRILERALAVSTLALAIGALMLPASAAAHDVATRCDWNGCSHIVCNHTGDRCHRFYGDGDYRAYRESGYDYPSSYYRYDDDRYDDGYARDDGWRYDCDRDAERCYVRRGDSDYDSDWDD